MKISFEKVAAMVLMSTPAGIALEKPPMKGVRAAEPLPEKASE
jgi:hypothetical protein